MRNSAGEKHRQLIGCGARYSNRIAVVELPVYDVERSPRIIQARSMRNVKLSASEVSTLACVHRKAIPGEMTDVRQWTVDGGTEVRAISEKIFSPERWPSRRHANKHETSGNSVHTTHFFT
jgi:hypothetical protein